VNRLIVLICLGGLLPTASVGQTIVWTDVDGRRIQRKDVNGGAVGTIVQFQFPQGATEIHYDPVDAKLYYLFYGPPSTFQRANLDGSEPENIPTPSVTIWTHFTLNIESRKLYWMEVPFGSFGNGFFRSQLDGSGVESHTYPSCCLLTLEALGDDLFFGAGGGMFKGIWRADADGSNEQYLHGTPQPYDLAYDPVENKLYVATIARIYRLNPDGTGFQEIVPIEALQIVVDSRSRKLYWTVGRVIRRSNLDGSNAEDFVTALDAGNLNLDIQGMTIVDSYLVTGACCDGDPFAPCTEDTIPSQCECASCTWRPFRTCAEIECAPISIPTTSGWGVAILTLLLIIGAKIAFGRRAALSSVTQGG